MTNKQRNNVFIALTFLTDIIIIYLSFALAYRIRFYSPFIPITKGIPPFAIYGKLIPLVALTWLLIFRHYGFYRERYSRSAFDDFFEVMKAVSTGMVVIMAGTFLYRDFSYSRVMMAYVWGTGIVLLSAAHAAIKAFKHFVVRHRDEKHGILVIGKGEIASRVSGMLRKEPAFECHLMEKAQDGLEVFLKQKRIREIIIARSPVDYGETDLAMKLCEKYGIKLKLVPDIAELRMGNVVLDDYFGLPVLEVKPMPLSGANYLIKRIIDIVLAIIILSVMFVPMLVIAVLIRLDSPGPVFHRQKRLGYRGESFWFLKFRTMVKDADSLLEEIKHLSERPGPVFKMKNDPRVTRVGRFLRWYSLDELPQFFNVLKGNMSIVGPRPQVLWEASHYDDWAKKRLKVLPGITGYWQVSGRSDLSYEEMIRLDIYYTENWSLELDFKIILRTIPIMFSKQGAY